MVAIYRPRFTCRPPRGTQTPHVAPEPDVCTWCGGDGCEPDIEAAPVPCFTCDGAGLMPLVNHDLPRSRTHELRRIDYVPMCGISAAGELRVTTARKATHRATVARYQVAETDCDWPGRAFVVAKIGHRDRAHTVFVGGDELRCDCEGETYLTSAKANQRAWEDGEEIFPTYGCVHLDATVALLLGRWFD